MASDRSRFSIFLQYKQAFGISPKRPLSDVKDSWLPMRYSTKDGWILAVWVWRKRRAWCEVGLYLTEDHVRYVKDSGLKGSLLGMLTQAYHQTGRMEIRFIGPRPGREATLEDGFEPCIPEKIRRYAGDLGLTLQERDRITDAQGRDLYFRLTGFSSAIVEGCRRRGIDLLRACVLVHRDVWSYQQVEYLLRNAHVPERIFQGGLSPVDRLPYLHDMLVMRAALMDERLRIVFERFARGPATRTIRTEWETATRVRYTSDQNLEVLTVGQGTLSVKAKTPFVVTLVPRSAQAYFAFQQEDVANPDPSTDRVVAVTKDFEWSGLSPSTPGGTLLVPLFDTLSELDLEIARRLAQAGSDHSELSERHV